MKTKELCRLAGFLGLVVSASLLTACGDHGPQQTAPAETAATPSTAPAATSDTAAPASTAAAGNRCPYPPACGANCSNQPFVPTDCWTTSYGPAKADVVVGGPLKYPNMLYCDGGAYALCFFSGPPQPTGKDPKTNRPLPCVLDGDNANCTCQAYTSGPYFVDINAILNRGAYDQTVAACGHDGAKCANIFTCGADGRKDGCANLPQAPVCQYVKNQNPNDPKVSLIPKADLISTFSFAMGKAHPIGTSGPCNGPYAGCMTAPCFFKDGHKGSATDGEPVECKCPVYSGDYQVGQKDQACTIPPGDKATYVWSASNDVKPAGGK
jgi:hypothetical protein